MAKPAAGTGVLGENGPFFGENRGKPAVTVPEVTVTSAKVAAAFEGVAAAFSKAAVTLWEATVALVKAAAAFAKVTAAFSKVTAPFAEAAITFAVAEAAFAPAAAAFPWATAPFAAAKTAFAPATAGFASPAAVFSLLATDVASSAGQITGHGRGGKLGRERGGSFFQDNFIPTPHEASHGGRKDCSPFSVIN